MSGDLATLVPRAVAPFCRAIEIAFPGSAPAAPLDAATLREALTRFGRRFERPDAAALASLWSMYHFNAVVIPAVADLLCHDRILPVAADMVGLRLDPGGQPTGLVLPHAGRTATDDDEGRRFATLVNNHLEPVVALLAAVSPVTPRVLWSNAGTIFDWACTAIGARALAAPRRDALAVLAGAGAGCDPRGRLAGAIRDLPDGTRERRVCCTRYRLAGCGPCSPICPARVAETAAAPRGASPLASASARL